MRMGNYLGVRTDRLCVMSATQSSFGIRHPTVVPTNFEPADDEADESDEDDE